MKTHRLAAATFAGALPLLAAAETTNCTEIQSLPYTISVSGVYCLKSDLTNSIASGNAITIDANNVTIDLNGYRLGGGLAGTATQANGIHAHQRQNITIRNGTVRSFYVGVYLDDLSSSTSQGHLVKDIRADQNRRAGIWLRGQRSLLRRNQVLATGGSTLSTSVCGIQVAGVKNRVLDNDIIDTQRTGNVQVCGMSILNAQGSVVADNRVSELIGGPIGEVGISVHSSPYTVVRNNNVSDSTPGSPTFGIYVNTNSPAVVVVGNQVTGFVNGISINTSGIQRSGNVVGGATNPASGVAAQTY